MLDWVWSKLSQTTVTTAYLNSQDMISQVKVYVADTDLNII